MTAIHDADHLGMVDGMATKKVTITLDESHLAQIRALVERGAASSVSGFVQHAIGLALDDEADWLEMLRAAREATGGPTTDEERAWADDVLRGVDRPYPLGPGRRLLPEEPS
jgi:Arc/MetJ-type ribon-helix-helix transcriptional regulator